MSQIAIGKSDGRQVRLDLNKLVDTMKDRWPTTWHEHVLGFYDDMSRIHSLSDDCISLRHVIQDGLALLAENEYRQGDIDYPKPEPSLPKRPATPGKNFKGGYGI